MWWAVGAAAFVFVLYAFLIYSKTSRFACVDYAHRGLHKNGTERPENSMPAFALAVEKGYGIELDVQLSRDGRAVVFHDDTLLRGCGIDARVDAYDYEQLSKMPLFGSSQHMPLFSEVLSLVDGKVPLIVELKMSPVNNYPVCIETARLLDAYAGDYVIESFSPIAVRWYKKHDRRVARGQLSGDLTNKGKRPKDKASYFAVSKLLTNALCRPSFIAYDHTAKRPLSLRICKRLFGTPLAAWTIRTPQEYEKNRRYFNAMIFEGFEPKEMEKQKK